MVILPAKFSGLPWSSKTYSTGSSITYSSPSSIQAGITSKGRHNQPRAMHKQHDAKHVWYARYDMQCICVLRKENDEHGSNLANQACHWKDEMIWVEIDIKITGNGCTVCKWQAKQEWHESAINSMIALKMQQVTMLQHPNIATKHMAVIDRRCLTKYEHWATASSQKIKLKQAWKKCKRLQVHRQWKAGHGRKQHQVAMFRARNQYATGT